MAWGVLHTIGKLLKHRCLKWARITHLDIWNISYGQKKGQEKSGITPISLHAGGVRHTVGKLLTTATTLFQTSPQLKVYTQSYGAPKSRESQFWQFRDSHRTKSHLYVGLMERHIVYYKGGKWWLPPSLGCGESCESKFTRGSS